MCGQGDCEHAAEAGDVQRSMPRPALGDAVDPIGLAPVDEVVITTLVDNSYDGLRTNAPGVRRAPRATHRLAAALPDAYVPNAVGTSITLTAAA